MILANSALLVMLYLLHHDTQQWLLWSAWERVEQMLITCVSGIIIYLIMLLVLGLRGHHLRA